MSEHISEQHKRTYLSMTIIESLQLASARLQNIESGQQFSRLLLAHILAVPESFLWSHSDDEVESEQSMAFERLVERASRHEPLAYLLGYNEFYGMRFIVNENTLIPRPETERLVEFVVQRFLKLNKKISTPKIVDVGTGSGCVALSIAKYVPGAEVYAIDISDKALEVAQRNACQLNISNVTFRYGNLLQPLTGLLEPKCIDVIVANLPYIPDLEYEALDESIRRFEPELALRSNSNDPDALNKQLVEQAKVWLKPDGVLAYETTNGKIISHVMSS